MTTAISTPGELHRDWAVPPGEYLRRALEDRGLRQADLAERTGISPKHVNQLIKNKASISGDTAVRLERALGISALLWARITADYDTRESVQRADDQLDAFIDWVRRFDAGTLQRHGITDARDTARAVVDKVLRFFGVSSPSAFTDTYLKPRVSFRRAQQFEVESPNTALWLRLVELQAEQLDVPALRPAALRKVAADLPRLSALPLLEGFIAARAALKDAGVALVFVAEVPMTRVCAATWWFGPNRPVIGITERQRRVDTFWFNLMHEVGHVLLHPRRRTFLDVDETLKSDDVDEQEANDYAQRMLLGGSARSVLQAITRREQLVELAINRGVGLSVVAGQYAYLTTNYRLVASLRTRITDRDITQLEHASKAP